MADYYKFFPENFTLESPRVVLRLMSYDDLPAFQKLGEDPGIWKFFVRDLSTPPAMEKFISDSLEARKQLHRMPFTVIDKDTKSICGSTSFNNISFPDLRTEIGWSWLGKDYQGMGINKHCFFLLYSYAFTVMKLERVEAKTDVLNEQARGALLKVGMIPEGVLRSHTLMHGNRRRDTLYFSMLRREWEERAEQFFGEMM